jgi:hypothetical protein
LQNDITLQNEQMRQENYWRSVSGLSGVAQLENPSAFAAGATDAAGTIAGLSNAYNGSRQTGFFSHVANSLGDTLGHTLGGGNAKPGGSGGDFGFFGG